MTLTSYERLNSFKSTHIFTSGSTNIDPSGNLAFINVYQSDGTLYISATGARISSGSYYYYISTSTSQPLGIYTIDWWGYIYYDDIFTYKPYHNKECVIIDKIV